MFVTKARSAAALLAAFTLFTLLGCDAPGSHATPSPDSLLRESLNYLESLASAKVAGDVSIKLGPPGRTREMNCTAEFRMQRPDKLAFVSAGGSLDSTLITDGKQISTYLPAINRYTISEIGDGETPGQLPGGLSITELVKPLDADRVYDQIMKKVTGLEYLGRERVNGVNCHHCRYETTLASVDVWFEDGQRRLVRKVAQNLAKRPAIQPDHAAAMHGMQIQWTVTLDDWEPDAKFTDVDFVFTPPAGARQVDSLAGMGAGMPEMHALVGQPAPIFDVPGLDGNMVSLASHLGKDVVVLDFWATWCGPCVEALPEVDQVTRSLKDRGVVFYAVNLRQEPQVVVDFLKKNQLDIPVALDAEGEVGKLYHVSGIPQSVLIGKDGIVQVVHVGFSSNLKEQLTGELEQLLDGKDLAAEALSEQAKVAEQTSADEPGNTGSAPAAAIQTTSKPAGDEGAHVEAATGA